MFDRDQLVQQALALPDADRAFILDVLERSLAGRSFANPQIAAAWTQEIDRRLAAYDRGETTAIPFDVALDRIQRELEARRNVDAT